MMRLGRRASLLVAFFLLVSAATAHAECAWVLWRHMMTPTLGTDWAIESTAANQGARETAKAAEAAVVTVPGQIIRRTHEGVLFQSSAGSVLLKYVCLPDTIDPRGSKGR